MDFTKEAVINALRTNKWLHLFLLIVLPGLIYIQSVKFDYTNFDDNGIIKDKFEIVGNIKHVDTVLKVDAFFNPTGDFYRPVQNLTFMLDAQVSRDKLWMFHITNLLIHIFTCISLYFFLQLLKLKKYTAFLIALLFGVHPLFASGVGWVPSRGDILIGLEGILIFSTFHLYFTKKNFAWFILHSLLFLIMIFTKETTIFFPLLLLYYYYLMLRPAFEVKNFKKDILKLLPFILLWIAVCATYFIFRHPITAASGANNDVLGIIPFFKNNIVIPTIIGKFFIPIRLSSFPLYDNVSTIIGIVFLLGLLYITYEYSIRKKWAVLMGLIWFLVFTVPPTIYRLPNADIFFNYLEHRTYLPMIGIAIMIGFFLEDELNNPRFAKYFNLAYIPVILILGITAWSHCADYKNESTIRNRAVALNNPSAMSGRVGELLTKKDTVAALTMINKVIALDPSNVYMYIEKGKIMAKMQEHELAEQNFSLALNLQPNLMEVLLARSIERRQLKKYQGAFRDIFQASELDSANPKIFYSFGILFIDTKDYPNAVTAFNKCLAIYPKLSEAYNNRGYAKMLLGNDTGAIADCKQALIFTKGKPNPIVFNNLGQAFSNLNKTDSAFSYFNKALALDVNFADGYFQRGKAKEKIKDTQGACKDWNEALRLGYIDTTGTIANNCKSSYIK